MSQIITTNHGPLIVASSFWGSAIEELGKVWVSCNAGAIRILIPAPMRRIVHDMHTAKYVICSRGPWPQEGKAEGVELLFEDGSDSPFMLHLGPESFDLLPADPGDSQWVVSVWMWKKNKPHKMMERPCHWRRVPKIPWMKPLE